MNKSLRAVFVLFSVVGLNSHAELLHDPGGELKGCEVGRQCTRELPGMVCADGSPAYYSVTLRKNAENVAIYIDGGGACWNAETCSNPMFVRNLSRPVKMKSDWTNGQGLWNSQDKENPFAEGFHIVSVPYCTGDAHIGSKTTEYKINGKKVILRHNGHTNLQLVFEKTKELFPDPKKVVLMGISSGGIAAAFNMRKIAALFPFSAKYILSDAGTPFLPQFLKGDKYATAIQVWGAEQNFPMDSGRVRTFGEVWDYNRKNFPEVRFGFIHSYGDMVMMLFATALGATTPGNVIRDTVTEAAVSHMGENNPAQKVFFFDNLEHTRIHKPLEKQFSLGKSLKVWIREMINDEATWDNVRPSK